MNDEIKEILSCLNSSGWYYEANKLLEHIINLQQENERLKDIVVEKDNQIKEMILQKTDYTAVNILEMKLEDYKSRCEKAIEYIKKEDWNTEYDYNLLNILQNGSEDNE